MNISHKVNSLTIFFILCSIWAIVVHGQNKPFSITDFGGVGDGKTDNTQALASAWKKACASVGGEVYIPRGTFFAKSGDFIGPCNGKTSFHVVGTLLASSSEGENDWLTFNGVDGLTIFGLGTLDGNGASAWSRCAGSSNCDDRPTTLKLASVKNTLIFGIRLVNSKMFQLNINDSENVEVKSVKILAPEDSPNTDGIHIGRSNSIRIADSTISTGDDCVSIGPGSVNVAVTGVFCGPGHGLSIGSLGKYKEEQDVSGIIVRNCTLTKTTNGLRIKTWAPSQSSILVSNITYDNINLNNVKNPILIDQYYCPADQCQVGGESSVQIKEVKYNNVRGSSSILEAVNIQCSKSKPCQDIDLDGVQITYNGEPTTAICSHYNTIRFVGKSQIPPRCK